MTDYEKMKTLFEELKIGFTENMIEYSYSSYKTIFLHYSNATFEFDSNGKYMDLDIVY